MRDEGPTEDVEATGDVDVDGLRVERVIRRGRRGGSADKTAVERCWFEVRRHVLKTVMSASGSVIYSTCLSLVLGTEAEKFAYLNGSLELCLEFCDSIYFHVDIWQ